MSFCIWDTARVFLGQDCVVIVVAFDAVRQPRIRQAVAILRLADRTYDAVIINLSVWLNTPHYWQMCNGFQTNDHKVIAWHKHFPLKIIFNKDVPFHTHIVYIFQSWDKKNPNLFNNLNTELNLHKKNGKSRFFFFQLWKILYSSKRKTSTIVYLFGQLWRNPLWEGKKS